MANILVRIKRARIKKHLLNGGVIFVYAWRFCANSVECSHGGACCYDEFDNIEEAVDAVIDYAGDNHKIEYIN